MRIAFTSDLHTDLSQRNADLIAPLAQHVSALRPDAFVIAGDVAETLDAVSETLRGFAAVDAAKFYLAGNHDVFVEGDAARPGIASSQQKYERDLPRVAAANGFRYLGLEPHRIGDVAFVGTLGWSDYTLRDESLDVCIGREQYVHGLWRTTRAFDAGHVFWPRTGFTRSAAHPASLAGDWAGDDEICAGMLQQLDAQLAAVAGARAVVAAVHVVPFAQIVDRGAFGDRAFHDAYLGSRSIGDRLLSAGNVRLVVTGHLHRPADVQIEGVRVVRRPVGDARKVTLDLPALARAAVGVADV